MYNIPSINFASSVSGLSHPNDNDDNEVLKMIVAKKEKIIQYKIIISNWNLCAGGVEYISHIQGTGWETTWKSNGGFSSTTGLSKRVEAIKIRLTGDVRNIYDIWYRAHVQTYGWLGWTSNGQMAGSIGLSKRMEAIQILLIPKNGIDPTNKPLINYEGKQSVMSAPCVFATDNS